MNRDLWQRAQRIADLLLDAAEHERAHIAEQLCCGDAELARLVAELTSGPEPPADFLDPLAIDAIRSDRLAAQRTHSHEPPTDEESARREFLQREFERRYEVGAELGQGGIGEVHALWDRDLRRSLAMKVLRPGDNTHSPDHLRQRHSRFIEEGQITAQLDHPGIVPVHDLGIDPHGRVFFTMKQVQGVTLRRVFDDMKAGSRDWSLTRVLALITRVCEAVAYAHGKRVIHRDLKPTNIMVGGFGETYVMDWGLARVLDAPPAQVSGEPSPAAAQPGISIRTERRDRRRDDPGSPDLTREGQTLGTPAYMAPEQARGDRNAMAPALDIYAVGAMLYELLAGQAPYAELGELTAMQLVDAVSEGPPEPLANLKAGLPPELVSICQKAMDRRPRDRYASIDDLLEDLRAYQENRVVAAHRTGPFVEFRLWAVRNRAVAITSALLLVAALVAYSWIASERGRRLRISQRLRDQHEVALVEEQLARLSPFQPDYGSRRKIWLEQAQGLIERSSEHRQSRERLLAEERQAGRVRQGPTLVVTALADELDQWLARQAGLNGSLEWARSPTAAADPMVTIQQRDVLRIAPGVLLDVDAEVERLRDRLPWEGWVFDDAEKQVDFAQLNVLLLGAAQLSGRGGALERFQDREALWQQVDPLTHQRSWRECIDEVAASPRYGGLRLAIQQGLAPLGENPRSGLHEFWHVLSGAAPAKDETDGWVIRAETGLVLVLVPGGETLIGLQSAEPAQPGYFPSATPAEQPTVTVRLEPFFLSRYEMTQSQWQRLTGDNPSALSVGMRYEGLPVVDWTHPVEQVSWYECTHLADWGLCLPTESEWEHAARAGTVTAFADGDDPLSLSLTTNFADACYENARDRDGSGLPNDGFVVPAPVDCQEPNPLGFHQMNGNVREWCEDVFTDDHRSLDPGHARGIHARTGHTDRVVRGGSYRSDPMSCRSTLRSRMPAADREKDLGVRPARVVQR